jgi:hypothetical protein
LKQVAEKVMRQRLTYSDGNVQVYANPPAVASNLSYTQNIPQQRMPSPTYGNPGLADRVPNAWSPQQMGTAPQYTFQNLPATGLNYANQAQPVDPAEISATNEINQLRNQLRSASGDQKKAVHKSLTEAVGKLFDLRHAAQAKQVERLESELAEAKELHKKRGERKDEIVERRMAELLQSADDLAWNREIAGAPNANYAAPYGYAPTNVPYNSYTVPLRNDPYIVPVPQPVNPSLIPQSSTPPQFIPLSARGKDPAAAIPVDLVDPVDAAGEPLKAPTKIEEPSNSARAMVENPEPLLMDSLPKASIPPTAFSMSSKAVIEAAYAYEEALEAVIEAKRLAAKGAFSARELSSAKRNAAKGKAIWTGMCKDLERRVEILKRDLDGKKVLIRSSTRERRTELGTEIEKLQSEIDGLIEEQAWADKFKKESIDTLEKQLEQIEEKKAEENESGAAASAPDPNADLRAY